MPADQGKFRVPSLRNVGLRAPFFHNGGKADMQAVVLFYKLGRRLPGPEPRLAHGAAHDHATARRSQLVDFVQNGLTDPRVAAQAYPFDRPTLNSEQPVNFPSRYGDGSAGLGRRSCRSSSRRTLRSSATTTSRSGSRRASAARRPRSAVSAAPALRARPSGATRSGSTRISWSATGTSCWPERPGRPGAGYASLVTDIAYNPAIGGVTRLPAGVRSRTSRAPAGSRSRPGLAVTLIDLGP